ncbi:universal stress protein [Oceanidesulfovibrio marinus]|nr:universal stress protein [Oceanidesulfovibrio marinus]
MHPWQNIIVGVDLGAESLEVAVEALCAMRDAKRIRAVSVVPGPQSDDAAPQNPGEGPVSLGESETAKYLSNLYREALAKFQQEANTRCSDAEFDTRLLYGTVYQRLVESAEEIDADVTVVGLPNKEGRDTRMLGRTPARLIGFCKCDVLAIPFGCELDLSRILVAVDGSAYSRMAAEKARALARSVGGVLHTLCVMSARDAHITNLSGEEGLEESVADSAAHANVEANRAREEGIEAHPHSAKGPAYKRIVETARKLDAGLIVMGSHGRTGLMRLLLGSVAQRVLEATDRPVLVVRS